MKIVFHPTGRLNHVQVLPADCFVKLEVQHSASCSSWIDDGCTCSPRVHVQTSAAELTILPNGGISKLRRRSTIIDAEVVEP